MTRPALELAGRYVHERMRQDLPAELSYHTIAHTFDEVLPATERLADMEGLEGEAVLLLRTAAIYHDLGFIVCHQGHEEESIALARATLPGFGYGEAQIETIAATIRATKLPQSPTSLAGEILADADLEVLGREDFLVRNRALRQELESVGMKVTDVEWYRQQLGFLKSHSYFTRAATSLRGSCKQENIRLLEGLLAELA